MRVTYVEDKESLNQYKSKLSSEKIGFDEGSYKSFTYGYIGTCTDPTVQQMKEKLNEYYSKIETGYNSLNNWLSNYISDMDNLDNSLSTGENTVTDSTTNSYLNGFVDKINNEVTESGDTVEQMNVDYDNYVETDYNPNSNEEEIDLDEYIVALDELIGEYNSDIEMLEKEYDQAMQTAAMNTQPIIDIEKYPDLTDMPAVQAKIDELKEEVALLEYYKKEAEHIKELEPYDSLMDTDDFNTFLDTYNEEELYNKYQTEDLDPSEIDYLTVIEYQMAHAEDGDIIPSGMITVNLDGTDFTLSDLYNYTDDDQKLIYHYLFQTEGMEKANEYLELLIDDINKAKGAEDAAKWIEEFDEYYASQTDGQNIGEIILGFLASYGTVSIKGIDDGVTTFCDGIYNSLVDNGHLTSDEYAACIIREYLAENTEYYGTVYDVHSALGNMTPAIAASAITTALFTPAVGSAVGSTLMGVSAGGNAKHQALVGGSSKTSAWIYGLFSGASEATLGYFLGKIPGISKTSGFTLANLLSEGTEEFLQEWVDAGLRSVILGETVDLTDVTDDSFYSFFMGVTIAGYTNGVSSVANNTNMNIVIDGTLYEISREDIMTAVTEEISKNPDVNLKEVVTNSVKTKGKVIDTNINWKYLSGQVSYDYDFFSYYDVGTTTFGVDQACLKNLKTTNKTEYNRLRNKLISQGFTKNQATKIINTIDETGVCSYADVCNAIFSTYANDPNGFKQKFGFDMYTQNADGTYQLNSTELLLDLYMYSNSLDNGYGTLWHTGDNGKKYFLNVTENIDSNGQITYTTTKTNKLYTENQTYTSTMDSMNDDLLKSYLNARGGQTFTSKTDFGHHCTSSKLNNGAMQNEVLNVEKSINQGYKVSLYIASDPTGTNEIRMINIDGKAATIDTGIWNEGGAHAVYVTGTCNEGFIVSSWGHAYLIPYEDLQKGTFSVHTYKIN